MKNWQGIPTTRLPSGGEVMVPRDNRTLVFSTELLNYKLPFATQGKLRHCNIWWLTSWVLVCSVDKNLLWNLKMPAKVMGDSLLIHFFILIIYWSLFVYLWHDRLLPFESFDKTHSLQCPQRDVLSNKMKFWVVNHSFCFMLCQSSLLSTVISFVYKDKWWFDESMPVIFCMENTWKRILFIPSPHWIKLENWRGSP